ALYLFVHELGHALHRSLASDAQPAVSEAVPKHVGELPAFCHEALLADHLADRWEGRRARHAEAAFLRKLPLVRAVIGARFVREVQNSVAATPLGPDELADRYRTAAAPFIGHLAGDVGWEWQLRDLSRRPFHAYPYAVGVVGALATVRSLRTGELGSETYRERLALGRSERPVNLFRPAVDLTDRTTVERGLDAYRNRVERLLTG
ncbi:MAG: M3 family metallopeptidase, partial [Halobaculum sp.]